MSRRHGSYTRQSVKYADVRASDDVVRRTAFFCPSDVRIHFAPGANLMHLAYTPAYAARLCASAFVAMAMVIFTAPAAKAQYIIDGTETVPGSHASPWSVPDAGHLFVG